jgi:hypothetical protein
MSLALAGRLSSFEESEDDCDQRIKKVDATYTINYFNEEVLDISPWYEKERTFLGQKVDRVQTQTIPTHGFLLDKVSETKAVTFEVHLIILLYYCFSLRLNRNDLRQ